MATVARELLYSYRYLIELCCTVAVQYLEFAREAFDERDQSAQEHEVQTGHEIVLCCHHQHATGGYQTATVRVLKLLVLYIQSGKFNFDVTNWNNNMIKLSKIIY